MQTAKRPKRPWLVPISIVAHLAAGAGLWAAGVWSIERLPAAHADTRIGAPVALAEPEGGQPAAAKQTILNKQVPKQLTQPTPKQDHVDATPVAANTSDTGTGSGGSGDGSGSGSGTIGGGCLTPPCEGTPAIQPPQEPPPPPQPPKVRVVPPNMLASVFVSGEREIQPPDPVVTQMSRDGTTKVTGVYKICIAESGDIMSVKQLRSTGYEGYDRRLESGMSKWRYRPLMMDGKAVPACGSVTFIYQGH